MADWIIEYWQLPIAGLAVHGQLVMRNDAGVIIRSYEGLATSRAGKIKPIGYLWSDRIRVYVRARAPITTLTEARYPRQRLFSGDAQAVAARLSAADAAAAMLNRLDFRYPFLGILGPRTNSNAVISTLADVMGLPPPHPGGYAPGHGKLLLPHAALDEVRQLWAAPSAIAGLA